MAHTQDFIPSRDAEFDGWLANLTSYVDAKVTGGEWTHIPAEKVTALKQHNTDWHTAYSKTLGPHTAVDTEAKNDQRKAAEGFVRPFVQQYLKFDPVTNEDRTAMITDLKTLGGFQVEIRFQDEATPNSKAIPYGDNGCLLNYTWGPEKTLDFAALTQTKLMTHSPYVLTLSPEAEAKFLTCSTRWQNERGELGPWGEIQHIVIG